MDISPRWSPLTKAMMALCILAGIGFLLIRFQYGVAPLMMAVILAYLLDPVVTSLTRRLRIPRPAVVFVLYAVLILAILSLLGGAGIFLQQQLAGMLDALQAVLGNFPAWIRDFSHRPITFGPFAFRPMDIDLNVYQDALLNSAREGLARITGLVGEAASQVAVFFGWMAFILVVSFYLLSDFSTLGSGILKIFPPEYHRDAERLMADLGPIWNAFLRGQATLALVMAITVGATMSILGLRYSVAIGIFAGFMEFIPIIGPYTLVIVEILVAVFQPTNWMGLPQEAFISGIVVAALALQQVEANFFSPRIMAGQLRLHPALVIVGAFIGASLAGIPGLLLSSPTIATLRLFARYMYAKMQDLPPWPDLTEPKPPIAMESRTVYRVAAASDRASVMELSALIWEGHDYIPQVWDAWLADQEGCLAVGDLDGRAIAVGKLTELTVEEWWLEGLRVHPDYQGRKIGSKLFGFLVDRWSATGSGILRLATSSERVQIHRLCQRFGFRLAAELALLAGNAAVRGKHAFSPLLPQDSDAACQFSSRNELARDAAGFVNYGWQWSTFNAARASEFIARQRAWWWKDRRGLLLLYDDEHKGEPSLEVGLIAAPMHQLTEFLADAGRLAGELGAKRLAWTAPHIPGVTEAAFNAGLARESEATMWVFERSHPGSGT
jgi:predicted PurR-regulated permease PerM/GNAT superfamily N-acetyltransferase